MIWLWLVAAVAMFDVVLFGMLWLIDRRRYRRTDRQLAALEAARAVPDADNAALVYKDICRRWPDLPSSPPGAPDDAATLVRTQAWRSSDYPGLAAWLNKRQDLIAQLQKAAQIDKCSVPIWDDLAKTRGWSLYGNALSWLTVLLWSTNNELGDGHIDSAARNWQCLHGLARHLCQQPSVCHRIFGLMVESEAFLSISPFVVNDPACSNELLAALDSILLPAVDAWDKDAIRIACVESLCAMKRAGYMPFVERLKKRFRPDPSLTPRGLKEQLRYVGRSSLHRLAQRRGMSILIALRQYKNGTARWPANLDEIRGSLPDEMLIDPRTSGPFAYLSTDQDFTLSAAKPDAIEAHHDLLEVIDTNWSIWPVDRMSAEPMEKRAPEAGTP